MNIKAPQDCHIPLLRQLWKETFGDSDAFLDCFFKTAFSSKRCRMAMEGDAVVAALYWFDCLHEDEPIAYLYAIGTHASRRGQGICHTLMEDTHKLLAKTGYKGAILVPATLELFEFYKSMGYESTCFINEFSCNGQKNTLDFRPITEKEYAALRRKFLPMGGVIQEKENLDFFRTEALFYTGNDFLLAARAEGKCLRGLELLGNSDTAPALVHALGFSQGVFRTPGTDKPFAMYLPFDPKTSSPTYFGIAFD